MRKAIKKFRTILTVFVVALLSLALLLVAALSLPPVQQLLSEKLSAHLSEKLGAQVVIGKVRYFPLSTFSINDITISDTLGNRAASLQRIKLDVSPMILLQQTPNINELTFDSLSIFLYHLPDGRLNFSQFQSQNSEDTLSAATPRIVLNRLLVRSGNVSYSACDGRYFYYDNIKFDAANILAEDSVVTIDVNRLSFSDLRNGKDAAIRMRANLQGNQLSINNLLAKYAFSKLDIDSLSIDIESVNENNPKFFAHITNVEISPEELQQIAGRSVSERDVKFSGLLRSDESEWAVHNFMLEGGENTAMWLDAALDKRTDFSDRNVDVRIHRLSTSVADIQRAMGHDVNDKTNFAFGVISASGGMSGKLGALKMNFDAASNVAKAKIDASGTLRRDTTIEMKGKVNLDVVNGNLLTDNVLQRLSSAVDFDFEGHPSQQQKVHLHAAVPQLEMYNYSYSNILFDGFVDNKIFQCIGIIDDKDGLIYAMAQGDIARKSYELNMRVDSLCTTEVHLTKNVDGGMCGFVMHTTLDGSDDKWTGNVDLTNCYFATNEQNMRVDHQNINIVVDGEHSSLELDGGLVSGNADGCINIDKLLYVLDDKILHTAQIFKHKHYLINNKYKEDDISFNADLKWNDNFSRIVGLLSDGVKSRGNGRLVANIDTAAVNFNFAIDTIGYAGVTLDKVDIALTAGDKVDMRLHSSAFQLPMFGNIGVFDVSNSLKNNDLFTNVKWSGRSKCDININTYFEQNGDSLLVHISNDSATISLPRYDWQIAKSNIDIGDKYLKIKDFVVSHNDRHVIIDGTARGHSKRDTLQVQLSKIRMEDVLEETPDSKYSVYGDLTIDVALTELFDNIGIDCKGGIDRFYVNHDYLERLDIQTNWIPDSSKLDIDLGIMSGGKCRARGLGYLDSNKKFFDLMFNIDSVSDGFLNFYLGKCIRDISGTSSGWLRVHGPLDDLQLHSRLVVHPTVFTVRQTNVTYTFNLNDSIILSPDYMEFKHLRFVDKDGQMGDFHGGIEHTMFSNLKYGIIFDFNRQQVLNTTADESPSFYGNLVADGRFTVGGNFSNVLLNIDAVTQPGSDFYMQPFRKSNVGENSYIQFRTPDSLAMAKTIDLEDFLGGLTTHLHVQITPDANIKAIVDERTNNLMTVRGNGNLDIDVDRNGDMRIFGDYVVNRGTYNFTFGNIVNKRFEIQDGSKIMWDGAPMNANIDLTAVYKLKASLYDLVQDQNSSADLKRRVPVQCNMHLTNRLVDPTIKFDIEVPSSQNYSQYTIDQYINSEEEMNRQVFMLLAAGRFYASQAANGSQNSQTSSSSYIGTTISELLSNQLSDWISQNNYNLGLGVNYRPGDDEMNEEYALAVSTQMLNNKIVLSGNVGYGRDASEPSNDGTFIGDFDVEVKLNKKGSLRAKAYTHSNNDVIYETSPTTQGIGVSYQEDFNTFGELIHKYWYIITGQRRRDRKAALEAENK